jgi:hypothetical protein
MKQVTAFSNASKRMPARSHRSYTLNMAHQTISSPLPFISIGFSISTARVVLPLPYALSAGEFTAAVASETALLFGCFKPYTLFKSFLILYSFSNHGKRVGSEGGSVDRLYFSFTSSAYTSLLVDEETSELVLGHENMEHEQGVEGSS